jgi:hypothetical protein
METFYANLPEGHVLKTLYREHEIILKTLDEIAELKYQNSRIINCGRCRK